MSLETEITEDFKKAGEENFDDTLDRLDTFDTSDLNKIEKMVDLEKLSRDIIKAMQVVKKFGESSGNPASPRIGLILVRMKKRFQGIYSRRLALEKRERENKLQVQRSITHEVFVTNCIPLTEMVVSNEKLQRMLPQMKQLSDSSSDIGVKKDFIVIERTSGMLNRIFEDLRKRGLIR